MANEIYHATGTRLLALRKKLAAREGIPGYERNCEAIRVEIARLERSTIPTKEQIAEAWKSAEEAREESDDVGR